MWYVLSLRSSINRAIGHLTLTLYQFYQHGNYSIILNETPDSKYLLDGDKCLLGWDPG